MTKKPDIYEACIQWGKERGLFDDKPIHCWRTQFIKLLQEWEEFKVEVVRLEVDMGRLLGEAGDVLFVLNNLAHCADIQLGWRAQGWWDLLPRFKWEEALDSALSMEQPLRVVAYVAKRLCIDYNLVMMAAPKSKLPLDPKLHKLTPETVEHLLDLTLRKNSMRKGTTKDGNFQKEEK